MRERAEAKKKAAAMGETPASIGRRQTMRKVLDQEERRISESQVKGATLSFNEQL